MREIATFQLLYVCAANVCRSVLAERLTLRRTSSGPEPMSRPIRVASAGTEAVAGRPLHPYVRDLLRAYGASTADFGSVRLTSPLIEASDLVLTATAVERDRAIAKVPTALARTFTMKEFVRLAGAGPVQQDPIRAVAAAHAMRGRHAYANPADDDVADPAVWEEFRLCATELARTVDSVLASLGVLEPAPRGQA